MVNSRLEHPLKSPIIQFPKFPTDWTLGDVGDVRVTVIPQGGYGVRDHTLIQEQLRDHTLIQEQLEISRKKLEELRKKYDKLRSFPSTTMILTFNESTLRDMTGSDWKQILASADIVQY